MEANANFQLETGEDKEDVTFLLIHDLMSECMRSPVKVLQDRLLILPVGKTEATRSPDS